MGLNINYSLLSGYTGTSHHTHHSCPWLMLRWCRNSFFLFLFLYRLLLLRTLATQFLVCLLVYVFSLLLANRALRLNRNMRNLLYVNIRSELFCGRRSLFFHCQLNLLSLWLWLRLFTSFAIFKNRLVFFFFKDWVNIILLRAFKFLWLHFRFIWFCVEFLFTLLRFFS